MNTALDVYAMTNPALGGALIWSFLRGAARGGRGLELPLLFLPVPVLLSSSLAATFEGTSSRTGFFGWLDRHPEVLVDLAERVRLTQSMSRRSLLFASRTQLVVADTEGLFRPTDALSDAKLRQLGDGVRPLFPLARRFGTWVANVGSTRDVFYALGISP